MLYLLYYFYLTIILFLLSEVPPKVSKIRHESNFKFFIIKFSEDKSKFCQIQRHNSYKHARALYCGQSVSPELVITPCRHSYQWFLYNPYDLLLSPKHNGQLSGWIYMIIKCSQLP